MRVSLCVALALVGCSKNQDVETDTDVDSGSDGVSHWLTPLNELPMCSDQTSSGPRPTGPFTEVRTPSPFGTGVIADAVMGAIEAPEAVVQAPAAGQVDYTLDLDFERFDLYVPPAYDGSEAYGLLVHINAGHDGRVVEPWVSVLQEHKLIWVGGRGIGNTTDVDIRMGKAVLGGYRALEQFHIDRSRVYATGMSGGARTASVLAWGHPDLIDAAVPLCGAAYHREVEQRYETQNPGSHYEYWGDIYYPDVGGESFGEWALSNGQRFAIMTSFDDFREGDVMNIVHQGLELDGFEGRLLETQGPHCATSSEQLRDAIGFVEHPLHKVVNDSFDDGDPGANEGVGEGWVAGSGADTVSEGDGALVLTPGGDTAVALLRNRLSWTDPGGLIARVRLHPKSVLGAVSLWAYQADATPSELTGLTTDDQQVGLTVAIDTTGETPRVVVRMTGTERGAEVLFDGAFADWAGSEPLDLKVQVWQHELQIDMGAHFVLEDTTVAFPARLLDDRRTLRMRFAEGPSWPPGAWPSAVLTVGAQGEGSLRVEQLKAIDAEGYHCEG